MCTYLGSAGQKVNLMLGIIKHYGNLMYAFHIISSWHINNIVMPSDSSMENGPGGWVTTKIPSDQYRESHFGEKMISRSPYLNNGISHTGKSSLYWIKTLVAFNLLCICILMAQNSHIVGYIYFCLTLPCYAIWIYIYALNISWMWYNAPIFMIRRYYAVNVDGS